MSSWWEGSVTSKTDVYGILDYLNTIWGKMNLKYEEEDNYLCIVSGEINK